MHHRNGTPSWIRTNDLRLRSPLLYPTELSGHYPYKYTLFFLGFADWAEVGVLEACGMLEAVAKRAVNQDVEQPNKGDEEYCLVGGGDIYRDK